MILVGGLRPHPLAENHLRWTVAPRVREVPKQRSIVLICRH